VALSGVSHLGGHPAGLWHFTGESHCLFVSAYFELEKNSWLLIECKSPTSRKRGKKWGTPHSGSKGGFTWIRTGVLQRLEGMADEFGVAAEFGD
jgi:hypothetical protein